MSSLVYGETERVAKWVADLIPHASDFGECVAIGCISDDGSPIAGFVYNDYYPAYGTIHLSMAAVSPMWAKRHIIAEVLQYPFKQLDVLQGYDCDAR